MMCFTFIFIASINIEVCYLLLIMPHALFIVIVYVVHKKTLAIVIKACTYLKILVALVCVY